MFSQTAEYVLRIVVYLATQDGRPCTNRQIAKVTQVPEGYLAKILQSLARAGLVESQRGIGGGSVLTRPPQELTVYDVVSIITPLQRIRSCPLGLKSHGVNLCPLHRRMDQALALVEKAFRESTIADLISEPTGSPPLREALAADAS